ncbi:hypothetical protein HHL16_05820 [Pseudoflavitalea sp. G-6-1-2]|uniref:outer membrane beta-barrel protein n=1 Tax=Pseudoflavitalea sp. G-6-1-2 TaxID=2728841 RepID=UPI00146D7097|nr:hypothetical protein [Pseudoflavitalea sp. G-6-1-2]NML20380.1 hypothetical protein [Pseudoflavitalea sp. G-6-1-2]
MKRKLLLFAVLSSIACTYAQAQIKEGSVLLGGSLGYSRSESTSVTGNREKTINRLITAAPSVGIAIKDNLVVGGDLSYDNRKITYKNSNLRTPDSDAYGAGVFIRKYWGIANRLYLFGNGRLGYRYAKEGLTNNEAFPEIQSKEHRVSLSFFPGVSFAVSKKVHLESTFMNLLTIDYINTRVRENNGNKISSKSAFDFNSSFNNAASFTVGFKLLLSK